MFDNIQVQKSVVDTDEAFSCYKCLLTYSRLSSCACAYRFGYYVCFFNILNTPPS